MASRIAAAVCASLGPAVHRAHRAVYDEARYGRGRKAVDIFPYKVHHTESFPGIGGICHEKSKHHSGPLNHRKSDSYAAPAAERRSARAGVSNPEGSRP